MKSGRQKRAEIEAHRAEKRDKARQGERLDAERRRREAFEAALARGEVAVNKATLAPTGSYGYPDFQLRGTYLPIPFACKSCGKAEVWTPHQQKWWYETAKGDPFSGPSMCRRCRAIERRRKAEARRVHLEGVERKRKAKGG